MVILYLARINVFGLLNISADGFVHATWQALLKVINLLYISYHICRVVAPLYYLCIGQLGLIDGKVFFVTCQKLQSRLLLPLQEMSIVVHSDVRQRQLECVLQILQNNGEQLSDGWPLVLGVIGSVSNDQGFVVCRLLY